MPTRSSDCNAWKELMWFTEPPVWGRDRSSIELNPAFPDQGPVAVDAPRSVWHLSPKLAVLLSELLDEDRRHDVSLCIFLASAVRYVDSAFRRVIHPQHDARELEFGFTSEVCQTYLSSVGLGKHVPLFPIETLAGNLARRPAAGFGGGDVCSNLIASIIGSQSDVFAVHQDEFLSRFNEKLMSDASEDVCERIVRASLLCSNTHIIRLMEVYMPKTFQLTKFEFTHVSVAYAHVPTLRYMNDRLGLASILRSLPNPEEIFTDPSEVDMCRVPTLNMEERMHFMEEVLQAKPSVAFLTDFQYSNNVQAARHLVRRYPSVTEGDLSWQLCHIPASRGKLEMLRFMIDELHVDVNGAMPGALQTALHLATQAGAVACVAFLLERGADPHVTTRTGATAAETPSNVGYNAANIRECVAMVRKACAKRKA